MLKDRLTILFIIIIFIFSIFVLAPFGKFYTIDDVISPIKFIINKKEHNIAGVDAFDLNFSNKNSKISKILGITEEEAFILGNLGKYWALNLMKNRKVLVTQNSDFFFLRNNYKDKFFYSGFCLRDGEPCFKEAFEDKISEIRHSQYVVLDLDSSEIYSLDDNTVKTLENFLVIKKSQVSKKNKNKKVMQSLEFDNIGIYLTDLSVNLKPTRECSSLICKEFVKNVNNAKETIDIAIYGYSSVPEIENSLKSAISRGVKVRLVHDLDSKGKNIYPDTDLLVGLIQNSNNDGKVNEANNIMHNKFYIFDNKIVITGSANLSHTDMSGFNSNSVIVLKDKKIAEIYKAEFEQMYNGKFHNEKLPTQKNSFKIDDKNLKIYFSPQDKPLAKVVIPLIKNATKYIYIPTFVLTEKNVTEELIKAQERGVDVKIIIDSLNASIKHSKHKELRKAGIKVKTENYAGKMHSKSMIVDDKYTIIGSMNFSNSGENKNDENLVLIEDYIVAKFYKDFFLYQWNKIDNKWLKLNARAEGKDSIGSCSDGIDNNYDGLIDLKDYACK